MEGDVSLVEVDPKAQAFGELFPLACIAEDAFDAAVDERFDAELFDFFLRVDAEFLTNFDLDRQSVGVPSGPATTVVSTHRLVAREEVFDGPSQAVARVRQAVGRRRPFVKHEFRRSLARGQRLFVDLSISPETNDLFFELGEGSRTFNLWEHRFVSILR